MKMGLIALGLIIQFSVLPTTTSAQSTKLPKRDFTQPLDAKRLADKSLSELWLLRNQIFAQHGKPFRTYELHNRFMTNGWYKPNLEYSPQRLSKVERKNATLIWELEQMRRKQNYITVKGAKQLNDANIYNTFQYPAFTADELEKIRKNGFVTLPTNATQLYHIYENNDYLGIPSFITVDAVLQLYHLFFDMTLRRLEENFLVTNVWRLTASLIRQVQEVKKSTSSITIKRAAERAIAHLSVAYYFISQGKMLAKGPARKLALAEIDLCEAQGGFEESPLLNYRLDYSQMKPRGHYTRSDMLKSFFRAMVWLGLTGVTIKTDKGLIQGLLTTKLLYQGKRGDQKLIDLWNQIYEPTAFYVGLADDLTPADFQQVLSSTFGAQVKIEDLADKPKLEQARKELETKYKQRTKITGHGEWGEQTAQFRFMGQRFVPDSYIFHRLTIRDKKKNFYRTFPNGLDVMAVFGSPTAKSMMLTELKSTWEQWPGYPEALTKLSAEYDNLSEETWTHNLYYSWLWSLKALIELKDMSTLPFFMQSAGWQRKSLSTALASWAELRHDTILYAKQSSVGECGGDGGEIKVWIPEPPKGYVEPNVAFFQRLQNLLKFTQVGLTERKLIDNFGKSLFRRFIDLVDFLLSVAKHEVAGKPLSLKQYEQIQKLGSLLDNLTLTVLTEGMPDAEWEDVEGPDRDMPVIADVHTGDGSALEVGVGYAQEIYVVVERNGMLRLTRGAIFSYYEFEHPTSERLTDEEWQKMLEVKQAPSMPMWTEPYRSKSGKEKKLEPLYVPDFPQSTAPPWSTKPGWKTIYYETGC